MFADVGSHFRCGYTLAFWCTNMLEQAGVEETRWLSFPDGHGKEMCDGEGGRIEHWLKEESKAKEIRSNSDFCEVLNRWAQICEAQSPASARSIFYDFFS